MKKQFLIIMSSIAAVVFMNHFHRHGIVLKEWTLLSIAVPILYAGIYFDVFRSFSVMFILLLCLAPLMVYKYSVTPRYGIDMVVGLLTAGFSSIYLARVIRKDAEAGEMIEKVQDILEDIHANADEKTIFETMKSLFLECSGFGEADIYLRGDDGSLSKFGANQPPLPREHLHYEVVRSGGFFVSDSAADDPRLRIEGGGVEGSFQLAAFPVTYGGRRRGVVEIRDCGEDRLEANTVNFLLSILSALESALEIQERRAAAIDHEIRREKIKDTFSSYVTKSLAEEILLHPEELLLTGKLVDATVMFARISNFKELAAKTDLDDLFARINEFFSGCVELTLDHEGVVDKFIGDKIMACWGAPLPVSNAEEKATSCARAVLEFADAFNRRGRASGKPGFDVRIGVNSGKAVAGNIGSDKRMEYTVIGDSVNTAARINELAVSLGVSLLVGESVYRKLNENVSTRAIRARLKGKSSEISVYQL